MTPKVRHPLIDELARIQARDGLTGNDLARRLEVNPSSITRLMHGDMQPSLRIVQAVNREFPELRSVCAVLLRISDSSEANSHTMEAAAS